MRKFFLLISLLSLPITTVYAQDYPSQESSSNQRTFSLDPKDYVGSLWQETLHSVQKHLPGYEEYLKTFSSYNVLAKDNNVYLDYGVKALAIIGFFTIVNKVSTFVYNKCCKRKPSGKKPVVFEEETVVENNGDFLKNKADSDTSSDDADLIISNQTNKLIHHDPRYGEAKVERQTPGGTSGDYNQPYGGPHAKTTQGNPNIIVTTPDQTPDAYRPKVFLEESQND